MQASHCVTQLHPRRVASAGRRDRLTGAGHREPPATTTRDARPSLPRPAREWYLMCVTKEAAMPERRRSTIRSLVRSRRPPAPRRDDDDADGLGERRRPMHEASVSRIVDSAIYVDGDRVASPDVAGRDLRRPPPSGPTAWRGSGCTGPSEHEVASLASEFQLHPLAVEDAIVAHQRPEARALRRHPLRRPAPGPLPRRHRGGRVRRDPRLRRTRLRAHRPPQRSPRLPRRPAPAREPTRPAAPRARGGPLRHPRPGRRRLLPGRRRPRQRHRRDRDRGVQRRPQGVAPHLRAVPRGRRLPAGHPARCSTMLGRAERRVRQVPHRRGAPALPARRRGPPHPGRASGSTSSASCCATCSPSTPPSSPSSRTRR